MRIKSTAPAMPADTFKPHHVELFWMGRNNGWVFALYGPHRDQIGDAEYQGFTIQQEAIKAASEYAADKGVSILCVYKRNNELKSTMELTQ